MSASGAQPAVEAARKAPPEIDAALRKRVTEFYQHHVDGTTRKAMALVAEDAQDLFFNAQKSRVRSFEINEVRYGKDFKDATVMTLCEREVMAPLGGIQVLKMPLESSWKVEGGQWFWYVPKVSGCKETPFGCVPQEQPGGAGAGATMSGKDLEAKVKQGMAVAQNFGDFGFKNALVELAAGKTEAAEVRFANPLDGWLTLQLTPFNDTEVEVVPTSVQIKPKGEGSVTIRLKKKGGIAAARDLVLPFVIQPFYRPVPVRVVLKTK